MNNLEKLSKAGELAFGKNWQTPISRYLGMSDRTVRNFLSGSTRAPGDLSERLISALEVKLAEVSAALDLVSSDAVSGDSVTSEVIDDIVGNYQFRSEQDRKNAIDEMNNAVYETTYISDLHQIAKNWSLDARSV